jgi:TDG/mug DNA glycosylase family protein
MDALESRFTGCLIGAAVGDAFGMPLEFLSHDDIKRIYGGPVTDMSPPGPHSPYRHLTKGQYTDDTQMMMALAQAIIEAGFPDPYTIAEKFVEWYHSPGNNRGPGVGCMQACRKLSQGECWDRAGSDSAGNGAAMRVMPVALMYHGDEARIMEFARQQSIITHRDERAIEGAQLIALAVNYLLGGEDPSALITHLLPHAAIGEIKQQLLKVQALLELKAEGEWVFSHMASLGTSGYIVHTLGASLYAFLHSPYDFGQVVVTAANAGDDADTTACIAGALAGAYNGFDAIPASWVEALEDHECIYTMAQRLYSLYINPYKPVPDMLDYGLKAVFVGFNPGLTSAKEGHYYAYAGNHFWKLLYEAGILPEPLSAKDDRRMLKFGYGMIDIVKYPTRSASEITAQQYQQGRERLLRALRQYRPRLVCYNGKTIYAKLTGAKKVEYGLQPRSAVEGVADFVAVSSSPANAVPYAEKLQCYRQLADIIREIN